MFGLLFECPLKTSLTVYTGMNFNCDDYGSVMDAYSWCVSMPIKVRMTNKFTRRSGFVYRPQQTLAKCTCLYICIDSPPFR